MAGRKSIERTKKKYHSKGGQVSDGSFLSLPIIFVSKNLHGFGLNFLDNADIRTRNRQLHFGGDLNTVPSGFCQ